MRRAGLATPSGAHLVVAVSGGADSCALLHLVHDDAPRRAWTVTVAHVDHALRPDSADDAAWTEELAQRLGHRFRSVRLNDAPAPGESIEAWARRRRRAALRSIARACGADRILLGHHRDDQAETVLLNLVHGAGLEGLCGMAFEHRRFVRPLLDCTREELRGHLRRRGIEWREDPSNQSARFARNRLRASVLPLLQREFGISVSARIARAGDALRPLRVAQRAQIAGALELARVAEPGSGICLDRNRLRSYDRATLEGCMRALFRRALPSTRQLKRAHVTALADAVTQSSTRRRLDLPGGLVARTDRDRVRISRGASPPDPRGLEECS